MWTYWWYGTDAQCPWRTWYDAQNERVQAKHDFVFEVLESRPTWTEPYAKKLTNEDFVEIILKTKVQHRLFGFYWPQNQRCSFTFLLPATHKDDVYNPKDAFQSARKRMQEIKTGAVRIRRRDRPQ